MTNINTSRLLTDEAILAGLGERIAQCRIELQLTQAQLAEQAGVSKRTVERIESGYSAQMSSLIRILRVLDLIENLVQLVPGPGPRPMDLLRQKGKIRIRASSKKTKSKRTENPWKWKEDE